jgi:hypothetical protein
MSNVVKLGNITAIHYQNGSGSEVLLFKANEGLVCRVILRERGGVLVDRLKAAMERVTNPQ